jgi:hypothetical protein
MENLTICITTFKHRLNQFKELVDSIKLFHSNVQILVAINGEHNEQLDEDYRQEILSFISMKNNVVPIMFTEFRSLSKLWNTLVIFSQTDYNLVINDDLIFNRSTLLDEVSNHIKSTNQKFFTINGTFRHFVISKTELDNLGYFDERLLAHGEEDGDMVWRHIEKYKIAIPSLNVSEIPNVGNYDKPTTNMSSHSGNKPRFNRTFCFSKYQSDNQGIIGMFDSPQIQVIENKQQYPYEMFFLKNKKNMSEGTTFEI